MCDLRLDVPGRAVCSVELRLPISTARCCCAIPLGNSFNIPAVKVLDSFGVPVLADQAQRLGISSFVQTDDLGLALTLGGGEVRSN